MPKIREVKIGDMVKFTCTSIISRSIPKVRWIFNNGSIQGYAETVGYASLSIYISIATLKHSGFYTCYGLKEHLGVTEMFLARAQLKVFGKWHASIYHL